MRFPAKLDMNIFHVTSVEVVVVYSIHNSDIKRRVGGLESGRYITG